MVVAQKKVAKNSGLVEVKMKENCSPEGPTVSNQCHTRNQCKALLDRDHLTVIVLGASGAHKSNGTAEEKLEAIAALTIEVLLRAVWDP